MSHCHAFGLLHDVRIRNLDLRYDEGGIRVCISNIDFGRFLFHDCYAMNANCTARPLLFLSSENQIDCAPMPLGESLAQVSKYESLAQVFIRMGLGIRVDYLPEQRCGVTISYC